MSIRFDEGLSPGAPRPKRTRQPRLPATVTLTRDVFAVLLVLAARRAVEPHTFCRWPYAYALRTIVAQAGALGPAERPVLLELLRAHEPTETGGSAGEATGGVGLKKLWARAVAAVGG